VGTMPTRVVLPLEGDSPTAGREVQPREKEQKTKTTKQKNQGSKP
jgi:hypothetical protein